MEGSASSINGLDDKEGAVLNALADAANLFHDLERQHPNELREFVDGIHRCQALLALRACRRRFPAGWPTYEAE